MLVNNAGVKALSKTETERKLADALSHANWGASTTQMGEIAQATYDQQEYAVVMREVWAAIAEKPRNWRVVYKGLALLEFLLKNGSDRCVSEARDRKSLVRALETFSYNNNGAEKGTGVREKARAITELLADSELLEQERRDAVKMRNKFTGVGRDGASVASTGFGGSGGGGSGGFGGFGGSDARGGKGAKLDSDSDDEYMAEQKKKKKKAGKTKDDFDDDDNNNNSDDDAPKKSKAKKKQAAKDDDDFGFGSDDDAPPSKAKPSAKASKAKKKQADDDDDDFADFSAAKPAPAQLSDDDADFGFEAAEKPVKPAPITNISIKIPGSKASAAASKPAAAPAAAAAATKTNEIDLFSGDDWGAFSSPAQAKPATTAAAPGFAASPFPAISQSGTGLTPMQAAPAFGAFPSPPAANNNNMNGFSPAPMMGFPAPMMGGYPAPSTQQFPPPMQPMQPGFASFPSFAPQAAPQQAYPSFNAASSMAGAPKPAPAPAANNNNAAKKDVFAGLADLSLKPKPA